MKHTQLRFVTLVVATLGMAATALASNTRTWVSNTGVDSSTCGAVTSPCKTMQQAVTVTSAGGEVDVLDPMNDFGFYVPKALIIDGGGFLHIQVGGSQTVGINVQAGANDPVAIRNLSINVLPTNGGASPINWYSGATLEIENVSTSGGAYLYIAPTITAAGGSYFYAKNVTIRDTTVGGVMIGGTGTAPMEALIDGVTVVNAPSGIVLNYGQAEATHCAVMHASSYAFEAGPSGELNIADSTAEFSTTGMSAQGTGATLRIANNNIHDNTTGLLPGNGGQIISFGTNRLAGNTTDGSPSGTVSLK